MKKRLAFVPIVLSFLMLGAHFLRDGAIPGVAASVLMIGLLFVRRPVIARMAQAALIFAASVWALTAYDLAQMRMALGLPYARMVVILGTVAIIALLSAWLFQTKALRDVYRRD